MKAIEKLEPGIITSGKRIDKINELIERVNQLTQPDKTGEKYKKAKEKHESAAQSDFNDEHRGKEPKKKTYSDIIDEYYNEMMEASIARDYTKWNKLFENLKNKLETQKIIQDLHDFEKEDGEPKKTKPEKSKGLKNYLKPYKNTLVIIGRGISKLIDIVEDDGGDLYLICDDGWQDKNKDIKKVSWICGCIPLKGVLPDDDYDYLINSWNLNNNNPAN